MFKLIKINRKKQRLQKLEHEIESLKNEVDAAKTYIKYIENGNLSAPYPGLEGNEAQKDTLADSLINMREQLKTLNEKEAQRKWITEGLNKFMSILREQSEIEEISKRIISELIKYIGANQGGIYIADQEKEVLKLTALYAYNRKKFIEQEFEFGEGMIGQAFFEKSTRLLTEIPEDYINITSGLGEAPPRCIVIVPLKVNEQVIGILEIASFNSFESHHIEFLEKLGEYIASSFESLKKNDQTSGLLQKSQEQTEQLRAQEEEIKQNMEEMQATQEELARKEAESQSVLTALKDSYYVAELNLKGSILSVNPLLEKLFIQVNNGTKIEGESYALFSNSEDRDLNEIIAKIKEGSISSRTSLLEKGEVKIWLSETFSPIYDAYKNISKILLVATDITNEIVQQEELENKSLEIEEIRAKEKARADHSIKTQSKMMERFMQKTQDNEKELKTKIEELEAQLNHINQS